MFTDSLLMVFIYYICLILLNVIFEVCIAVTKQCLNEKQMVEFNKNMQHIRGIAKLKL